MVAQHNSELIAGLQETILQQQEMVQHQDKCIQIESYLRENWLKLCGIAKDICPLVNLPQIFTRWISEMLRLKENTTDFVGQSSIKRAMGHNNSNK